MIKLKWIFLTLILSMQYTFVLAQMATLTQQEKDDVLFMLEEEKMARDVYYELAEKWNSQVFQNIAVSEERHYAMMENMAKTNKLEIPTSVKKDVKGKFENNELQSLYESLVASGNNSLIDALKVGAKIEEVDINDLNGAIANTKNAELSGVYTRLLSASENHLRKFNQELSMNGVVYTPAVMDQSLFNSIINTQKTKGECCSQKSGLKANKGKNGKQGNACCSGKGKANKRKAKDVAMPLDGLSK